MAGKQVDISVSRMSIVLENAHETQQKAVPIWSTHTHKETTMETPIKLKKKKKKHPKKYILKNVRRIFFHDSIHKKWKLFGNLCGNPAFQLTLKS